MCFKFDGLIPDIRYNVLFEEDVIPLVENSSFKTFSGDLNKLKLFNFSANSCHMISETLKKDESLCLWKDIYEKIKKDEIN